MSSLVIVESPAKCKKIASFLGSSFTVIATMGHIRALEETIDAVGLDKDFEPRFRFLSEKSKTTKAILAAASKAKTIYLAADDDREGEAIAYSVACLLKKDPLTFPRSVFHEITSTAVKHAIEFPRKIDMNRVYAQQARSVLDMMVGFTISPLLWKYVARSLSAGRCQTPALRLISDREKQISDHESQTSWKLSANLSSSSHPFQFQATMEDELEDQESSLNYLENIHKNNAVSVVSIKQKPWSLMPPKPLITSTLQQEASALYHLNPKATMKIAQELYESGHITYMRTDSDVMSDEAKESASAWILGAHGAKYLGVAIKETEKKVKGITKATKEKEVPVQAQEAHECIRPTHFDMLGVGEDVLENPLQQKIYSLIWKRAVQSVMSAATGESRTITFTFDADTDKFSWSSSWKTTNFLGWQILGKATNIDDTDASEDESKGNESQGLAEAVSDWKKALKLQEDSKVLWKTATAEPKRTQASTRYTEAQLVRDLEKKSIGRPSTFASLVEVLFDKNYIEKKDIEGVMSNHSQITLTPNQWPPVTTITQKILGKEKQKLVPTALGDSVLKFCLQEFPELFAYDFTAQMEERLDLIAKGKEEWKGVCRDTWGSYKEKYAKLSDKKSLPSSSAGSDKMREFGDGLKAVSSKNGLFLIQEPKDESEKAIFYTFPPDCTVASITEEVARNWVKKVRDESHIGMWREKPIEKKKGSYGYYLQCGELRVPFIESETLEQIIEKFSSRSQNPTVPSTAHKVGPYIFSKGQYGPYMYKDLKTRKFVSIPITLDVKKLTVAQADAIYKEGLERLGKRKQ